MLWVFNRCSGDLPERYNERGQVQWYLISDARDSKFDSRIGGWKIFRGDTGLQKVPCRELSILPSLGGE